jgi:hypothetical protein
VWVLLLLLLLRVRVRVCADAGGCVGVDVSVGVGVWMGCGGWEAVVGSDQLASTTSCKASDMLRSACQSGASWTLHCSIRPVASHPNHSIKLTFL